MGISAMQPFFYSYEQMQSELSKFEKKYPGTFQKNVLGLTAQKREIIEVLLGNREAPHHLLIHAAIHGREYLNSALVMRQMEDYLKASDQTACAGKTDGGLRLWRECCFHVIPMVNPDGVARSQIPEFRFWKANARGVDLNRNFDAGWEEYQGAEEPCGEGYKGEFPGQEPEVQAILRLQRRYPFRACISYHSSGNLIYWDYGSKGALLEADRRLAEAIAAVTGYELRSTIKERADAAGLSDYFVLKCKIPSVTIETGVSVCPLPMEEFPDIYRRNREVWRAAADFVLDK